MLIPFQSPGVSPLAQARAAAVEHRFDVAASLAQHVLAAAPAAALSCLPALRVLAWAQLELGDDRAPRTFAHCAELDPEDPCAEVGQAIWYQQREQHEQAVQHWVRAWELDPYNQSIRRALVRLTGELPESALADGIGLLRQGRYEQAIELLSPLSKAGLPVAMLGVITALRALGVRRQADSLAVSLHATAPACVKGVLYAAAVEEAEGHNLRGRDLLARAEQADPGFVLFGPLVHDLCLLGPASPTSADSLRASRPVLASVWS
jgi:tetratricopeptide (TPR) repeat protein